MTMTRIPCDEPGCRGQLIKSISAFEIDSKIVGKVFVPNVEQHKCNKCDHSQLSVHSTDIILKYVRAKETEAINSLPIGEFVTPNQAIEILECTKQAFSKNARIKRGFIMSAVVGGKRLYHRRSVQLFKAGSDGRFLITENSEKQTEKRMVENLHHYWVLNTSNQSNLSKPPSKSKWENNDWTSILAPDNYGEISARKQAYV